VASGGVVSARFGTYFGTQTGDTLSEAACTVLLLLIAVLLFAETTIEKLAAHGVTAEEARQVADGDWVVIRNPRPRVAGSVLMIGPTHGGRVLTVVLNPESTDPGAWHVRTAWLASVAQRRRYLRDRK
jgi:hypothetical protein